MKRREIELKKLFLIYYPQMIEIMRLLAAPPEIQLAAFPTHESPPEEIAEETEYISVLVVTFYHEKLISKLEFEVITEIDGYLKQFSREDWTNEAIQQSDSWSKMRELARTGLGVLGIEYAKPNLYWHPIPTIGTRTGTTGRGE